MFTAWEARKYFSRNFLFKSFHLRIDLEVMENNHSSTTPFKVKGKAFNFIYSSSTSCGFIPLHTIWNFFKCKWGSSPARPLKEGNRWIKQDLSSKLTLLTWLHKGWLSRLRATSSLSFIGFEQPSQMDFRLMKLMMTMVKRLDWYRFHPMRMILLLQTRFDEEDERTSFLLQFMCLMWIEEGWLNGWLIKMNGKTQELFDLLLRRDSNIYL